MPNFATPAWFKPGVLPRKTFYGQLKDVPPFREVVKVIPRSDWGDLLKVHRGLRWCVPENGIYNQGSVGSCASEAVDQMASMIRIFSGQPHVLFNPLGTYNLVCGGRDAGSALDDNVDVLLKHGCFPESVWPRSKGWRPRPSDEAFEAAAKYRGLEVFDIDSAEEAVSALLLGYAVYYGSDGHAKVYVKALSAEAGLYVNSWSEGWGDGGFGTEAFASLWWRYGAFALRSMTDTGKSP